MDLDQPVRMKTRTHQDDFLDDFRGLVWHDPDGELSDDLARNDSLGTGLTERSLDGKKSPLTLKRRLKQKRMGAKDSGDDATRIFF